jgi:hypothetical protein
MPRSACVNPVIAISRVSSHQTIESWPKTVEGQLYNDSMSKLHLLAGRRFSVDMGEATRAFCQVAVP